jgi:hypothetical protein
MPIRLDLHFAGSPPPDMTERVRRALSSVFGEDLIRLERQYAPVAIQPAGNRAFRVDLLLDDTALERVANRAAGTVERELGLGPAQD